MISKVLWEEFTVHIRSPELGCDIPLCGLCGNSGIVDTTNSVIWKSQRAGIRTYCICPNGRIKKRYKDPL